jgi:hypothetical protein
MEYQVPQFIEVEDKIVGPLTLRQFIYLAGGGGICVIFFVYLPIILAILISVPIAGLSAALSFYKVNGKPFIEVMEAGFNYYTGAKLFLWKRDEQKPPETNAAAAMAMAEDSVSRGTPRLTRGKLSDLAWSLDVNQLGGSREERES